ncbi:hypothetical protein D3C80_1062720 [compost metagenome]
MRKEIINCQGCMFEIKIVPEATDLIVVLKYENRLLEFYHAHHKVIDVYYRQNQTMLEDRLYEIAKSEIESKFIGQIKKL